ncbi:hypothetical protein BH09PAT2_BH09PAT2_10410 [soil metagenome]
MKNKYIIYFLVTISYLIVISILMMIYVIRNQTKPTQIDTQMKPTQGAGGNGEFCGGIANIQCPSRQHCVLDGRYPDAGGMCQF